MDQKKFIEIEPNQNSGGELLGKITIGLFTGGILSILLFFISSTIGQIFSDSFTQVSNYNASSNPVLPLLIILIGFLVSFIGNIGVCGIYHLFFSKKYFKAKKSIGIIILTNLILFLFLIPIYFLFNSDINTMFMILGFHIIISGFLSLFQTELISNPNYGASSLIGSTLSLALIMIVYSIIWKVSINGGSQEKLYLLLLFPPVICYTLLPFGQCIRDSIYYKMYEIGNNPFFIESNDKNDDISEKGDKDDIDKDILNSNSNDIDDINVELN